MVKNLSDNAGDVRHGFDPMGQDNPMDSESIGGTESDMTETTYHSWMHTFL